MDANILQGRRVRLTALTDEDLPTVAGWFEDAEFMRMFDALPAFPKTRPGLQEWLAESRKAHDGFLFAVRRIEDDALIGYIELDSILWAHGTAWFSIAVGKQEHRSKGYGAEAAQIVLKFAFHELNLHRVQATVFSYNARSNALFQKLGFQCEGVFREFLQRDGQRHDMALYGLLRHEWAEAQSPGI